MVRRVVDRVRPLSYLWSKSIGSLHPERSVPREMRKSGPEVVPRLLVAKQLKPMMSGMRPPNPQDNLRNISNDLEAHKFIHTKESFGFASFQLFR